MALRLLPQSGSIWGLIERADPLVVTDRIEGGGAYPEMQRIGASGASWTQTSYRLGEADITDPDSTGFPLLYPNLDALEAMSVITAGQTPDVYGGGTVGHAGAASALSRLGAIVPVPRLAARLPVGQRAAGCAVDRAAAVERHRILRCERPGLVAPRPAGRRRPRAVVTAERDSVATPCRAGRRSLCSPRVRRHGSGRVPRVRPERSRRTPFGGPRQARGSGAAAARSVHGALEHVGSSAAGGLAWTGNVTYASGASTPALSGVADHRVHRALARRRAVGSGRVGY